jgi:large subunit ribosomal protein L21
VKEEKAEPAEKKAKKSEGGDLLKIGGIGPAFEKRLNALGVHTLEDLAGLSDERIAEMETQDSMTSMEQWHKWIEEAKGLI